MPKDPFSKALAYLSNREVELSVFLTDADVPIDTNHLERLIRPIPMGRRNWLFCWTELGAKHVGIIQSLISTCKLHASIRTRIWWMCCNACRSIPIVKSRNSRPGFGSGILLMIRLDQILRSIQDTSFNERYVNLQNSKQPKILLQWSTSPRNCKNRQTQYVGLRAATYWHLLKISVIERNTLFPS